MMQFYAQDTMASYLDNSGSPFDFSIDPFVARDDLRNTAANLIWYTSVGSAGVLGFSGAFTEHYEEDFKSACEWFGAQEELQYVLLMAHWNQGGSGCASNMTMPEVYSRMRLYPGCAEFGDNLIYHD